MKYGCNYSKELLELLDVKPDICDYIKIGAFGKTIDSLDESYQKKPLLLHGFGWFERGGMTDLSVMKYDLINKSCHKYKTPFLAMHCLAYEKDAKELFKRGIPINTQMIINFKHIADRLDVPLLVENMDYSEHYDYEVTVEETVYPEFIKEVIEESDSFFLFDLSHAKVSAFQLGIGIYDYIDKLPLHRLKEIHFSGSFYSESEGFKDIHGIMDEDDFTIATYIKNHKMVKDSHCLEVVTLEYGSPIAGLTDKKAIEDQLNRLKGIFD